MKCLGGWKSGFRLGSCQNVPLPTEIKSTFCIRISALGDKLIFRWVNGSEELYQKEKRRWIAKSPVFQGQFRERKIRASERRYREHDELRYSIRSIFKYLANGFSHIRILGSDFYDGTNWIGQIPTWLDLKVAEQYGVSMLYTSELYGSKKSELPVFSSLALESQFYNVPSTGPDNDVMMYLNDDMFLASEHSVSDFWNPISGVNFQIDVKIMVQNQDATINQFRSDWNSEWTALRYSNLLLSNIPILILLILRPTVWMETTIVSCPPWQSTIPNNSSRTPK
jgi:Stealth protein CR2, conserved region 2